MIEEIAAPLDLELGTIRRPLQFGLDMPSAGIGANTGLIFYIHGFGAHFDDAYALKLRTYLADRYDCMAVSVNYHDAAMTAPGAATVAPADFLEKLKQHHGIDVTVPEGVRNDSGLLTHLMAEQLFPQMSGRGLTQLHAECHWQKVVDDYFSFGLLPALDHLAVAAHVLQAYRLDRSRIFLIGTSYGGYIGTLMAKFAPNTLRLVVDNSGFTGPGDDLAILFGASRTTINGVTLNLTFPMAFSPDPASPYAFTPRHYAVRNLDRPDHWATPNDTAIYAYHSHQDTVAPTARKQVLAALLARARRYDLRVITPADVDGRLFKDTTHGMRSSLRGLFDLSYDRWMATSPPRPAHTDFDMKTQLSLACGDKTYTFRFHPDGVKLDITDAPMVSRGWRERSLPGGLPPRIT